MQRNKSSKTNKARNSRANSKIRKVKTCQQPSCKDKCQKQRKTRSKKWKRNTEIKMRKRGLWGSLYWGLRTWKDSIYSSILTKSSSLRRRILSLMKTILLMIVMMMTVIKTDLLIKMEIEMEMKRRKKEKLTWTRILTLGCLRSKAKISTPTQSSRSKRVQMMTTMTSPKI